MTRSLSLRADGSVWRTEGIAFPRDGPWAASIPLADGGGVDFQLEVG